MTRSAQTEGLSVCLGTPQARNMCCDISRSLRLLPLTRLCCELWGLYASRPHRRISNRHGLDLDNGHLRRYLGRRLVILPGNADNDPSAPDLPRTDYAMAQGPHRLARGLWHFQHCMKLADSLGVHFGWRLEIAHGAGHVGQQIYDQGTNILKGQS